MTDLMEKVDATKTKLHFSINWQHCCIRTPHLYRPRIYQKYFAHIADRKKVENIDGKKLPSLTTSIVYQKEHRAKICVWSVHFTPKNNKKSNVFFRLVLKAVIKPINKTNDNAVYDSYYLTKRLYRKKIEPNNRKKIHQCVLKQANKMYNKNGYPNRSR